MQVVWVFLVFFGSVMTENYDGPIVKIKDSEILGTYKTSYKGRTYSAFEGLPYGKPPVEDLRFEDPQPLDEWPPKGQFVANQTYICMSFIPFPVIYGVKGTEDCLYSYIYVPRKQINGNENLDVVVHIHGGAFMLGSPKYMAEPDYLMDRDLVVVTINYRLGILGFLSTEDEVVPGNMGLKDQSLALKWIKENIKYFGGNPDSITITGVSAGAASVHYHYLSPLSKGLFHRGFSQSGTVLQPWALTENPLAKAKFVASDLDCPTESTKDMVACLKATPGTKLVNGIKKIFTYLEFIPYVPFGPVVEKAGNNKFLRDHPYKLLEKGDIFDVPWINTNTIEEGIFPVGFLVMLDKIGDIDENWNRIMIDALELNDTLDDANKIEVIQKIRSFYLKDEHITIENIYSFIQVFTDRLFLVDSEKAMRSHSKRVKAPVYYYLFSYVMEMPTLFVQIRKGVAHSDDTRFLFKIIGNARNFKGNDAKMMDIFTEFLSEFARTGKPVFNGVEWKKVDPSKAEIDYLHIGGPDDIVMKSREIISSSKKFWGDLPIRENDKI